MMKGRVALRRHLSARRRFRLCVGMAALATVVSLGPGCGVANHKQSSRDGRQKHAQAVTTTAFQARILRDGRVTFPEYRRSTMAVLRCLKSGRVSVSVRGPRPAPGHELEYFWAVRGPRKGYRQAAAVAGRRFERCHQRFEDAVKVVYGNQRVIPPSKRNAVLAQLVGCLRSSGLRVPDGPPMRKLIATIDGDRSGGAVRCADRYADLFRIPAPLPQAGG